MANSKGKLLEMIAQIKQSDYRVERATKLREDAQREIDYIINSGEIEGLEYGKFFDLGNGEQIYIDSLGEISVNMADVTVDDHGKVSKYKVDGRGVRVCLSSEYSKRTVDGVEYVVKHFNADTVKGQADTTWRPEFVEGGSADGVVLVGSPHGDDDVNAGKGAL